MRFFNPFTPARTEIVNKKLAKTTYYSRSAENGADKVLSRGEENSSVHMTYVNFLKPRKSALDMTLYAASSGRSMVEMLGVLAIIGVLSVGAVAGYSKAMMKHKLNKQTEQITTVLNAALRYTGAWEKSSSWQSIIPYLIVLNEIPKEMIGKNHGYLKDIFGYVYYSSTKSDSGYLHIYASSVPFTDEVCQNIWAIGKEYHQQLSYMALAGGNDEISPSTHAAIYYGDSRCGADKKCLRNMTLYDMDTVCRMDTDWDISVRIIFEW